MSQLSFFSSIFKGQDLRLNALGDPLQELNKIVNWDEFYPILQQVHVKANRKNNAGRKPLDEVMMFKILVLQHHYNLSDQQTEYQIEDRRSFRRFIGLHKDIRSPDEKTIHLFREKLTNKSLLPSLFALLEQQIKRAGFIARQGQLIDASIIPAPIQRNSRKENQKIKEGEQPQDWSKNKSRQKDTQAKWTSKNGKQSFGYKNHINIDNEHKIIRSYTVTSANVHDSQVIDELLIDNDNKDIYADSAYRSEKIENNLKEKNFRSRIHRKGSRNNPLSKREELSNQLKSKTRVRVEHIFGLIKGTMNGRLIRTIGLKRAETKIGLTNLVYNMKRFGYLNRISASEN